MIKTIKKITAGVLAFAILTSVTGLALKDNEAEAAKKYLKLAAKKVNLKIGDKKEVKYKSSGKVKAVSSNRKVAKVTINKKKLVIKGRGKGKAVITVSLKADKAKKKSGKTSDKQNKIKSVINVKVSEAESKTTPTPDPEVIKSAARELSPFASAVNKFGMQVYNGVRKDNENMFISPFSIYTALAMLTNGAGGNTRTELMNTLGITNLDEINNLMKNYCQGSMDENVTFNVANSLWLDKAALLSKNIDKAFINPLMTSYNSEVFKDISFVDKKTPSIINKWVDAKTNGMIKNLLDEISPDTVAILMNALYFQGNWRNTFLEENTKEEIFHGTLGDKNVSMMLNSGRYPYFKNDMFKGIELDYGYQSAYAMDILLSADENVRTTDLWKSITVDDQIKQLMEWNNSASTKKIRILKLPKFDMQYNNDLVKVLSGMGINDVFDENRANLQNIGKNILVSGISHKTALSVNEKGSKAAAVTAIRMVKSMAPVQVVEEEIDFIVDRPFVFAIRDKVSGMILFIGEVNNL